MCPANIELQKTPSFFSHYKLEEKQEVYNDINNLMVPMSKETKICCNYVACNQTFKDLRNNK